MDFQMRRQAWKTTAAKWEDCHYGIQIAKRSICILEFQARCKTYDQPLKLVSKNKQNKRKK